MPASERATLESMAARVRDQAINQGHELAGSGAEGIAPDEYYFALAMAAIEAAAVFGRRGGMDASWLRSELSRSLLKVEEDERERAKADCEVLFRKASRSRKALN